MAYLESEWTGAHGIVYYGETLLYVDKWSVQIVSDTVDITNISIYTQPVPLPAPVDANGNPAATPNEPFPNNLPDANLPYQSKANAIQNLPRKQAQYGAARLNLTSGLRVANITCSGLCATYNGDDDENYMPRINNYVYLQFSNDLNINKTLFNFPICLVKNVTFDFDVKNYQRWSVQAISTGEFDVFPGLP